MVNQPRLPDDSSTPSPDSTPPSDSTQWILHAIGQVSNKLDAVDKRLGSVETHLSEIKGGIRVGKWVIGVSLAVLSILIMGLIAVTTFLRFFDVIPKP